MIGTMAQLFKAAGYEDYKSLPIGEFVKPKKHIKIASWDGTGKVMQDVTGLIYKGEADGGYKITTPKGSFLCTGKHLICIGDTHKYENLDFIWDSGRTKVNGLGESGELVPVSIEKVDTPFSILDLSVNELMPCYYSAGILSHNTFGSSAKAMSEMLNKMIPALAIYNTTLFWISQERANMDPMSFLPALSGGFKPGFAASIVLRVQSRDDIKNKGEVVGHYLRARNMKNKCSIMGRDAFMYLNFMDWKDDKGNLHPAGFETDREYISYFVLCDLLHKETSASGRANGYYSNEEFGIRIRGEEAIATFFNDPANAEVYQKMKDRCNQMMRGHIEALDKNVSTQEIDEHADGDDDTSNTINVAEMAAAALGEDEE